MKHKAVCKTVTGRFFVFSNRCIQLNDLQLIKGGLGASLESMITNAPR